MKVFLIALLSQALFCSLVLGHYLNGEHHDHDHDDDHHTNKTNPIHQITPYNANFTYKIFSHLAAKYPTGNLFFSPLSISYAISMLSLGAKSQTHSQILEGLGFSTSGLPAEDIHMGFHLLLHVLNRSNDDVQLSLANALFVNKDIKLLETFRDDARNYYHSEIVPTDFQNTEEAKNQINTYVENATNGKIKDLLDSVDPVTAVVLLNTIFFKGTWKHAFNKNHTREGDFHVDENTVVKVPMMTRQGEYRVAFIQEPECKVVEVPYKGNTSAILILPDAGKLHKVEQALRNASLQTWTKLMRPMEITLSVPKFSVSATLDLKDELSELGMPHVFSHHANFSGITGGSLKVSKAVHKAMMNMDEEGTEAAAATGIGIEVTSLTMPIQFNRPFLCIIVNKDTKTTFFTGRIAEPGK
ncbi:alpha-1-antiproteinase-like [Pseudophryne corroboree]|uniref:alpha-1-antiproteinase-like n=1 Tax=Pseudophryne corroboree TaxID=495146 RepID=UPI0030812569